MLYSSASYCLLGHPFAIPKSNYILIFALSSVSMAEKYSWRIRSMHCILFLLLIFRGGSIVEGRESTLLILKELVDLDQISIQAFEV